MKNSNIIIVLGLLCLGLNSCKKYLDTGAPINQVSSNEVFLTESSATSAVAGLYSKISSLDGYMENSFVGAISFLPAMSADEIYDVYPFYDAYKENSLTVSDNYNNLLWGYGYEEIYAINSAIEGLSTSSINAASKNQLLGECYTLRAFCYFYLTNLYGDIPLILTTDLSENRIKGRNTQAEIYVQILQDLTNAQSLLTADYPSGSNFRVRINRAAATALLARVYLYQKNYTEAERQASTVIDDPNYSLSALNETFKNSSNETIFQLFTFYGYNQFGYHVIPNGASPEYVTYSNLDLSFETGDSRKSEWLGTGQAAGEILYYPTKYQLNGISTNGNEYTVVFRLAEQYLIRAEARAHLGKFTGTESASSDLNVIRDRADLGPISVGNLAQASLAIENERYHELFFEFGHRWLDLKRTGRATAVLSAQKPTWTNKALLYPIPSQQIALVPGMTQNPGY